VISLDWPDQLSLFSWFLDIWPFCFLAIQFIGVYILFALNFFVTKHV
jgi:hypothetical protein